MGKRPRERDRPKAGPGAAYNPNKRILLSYDSEEETKVLDPVPVIDTRAAKACMPAVERLDAGSVSHSVTGEVRVGADGGAVNKGNGEVMSEEDDGYDPAAFLGELTTADTFVGDDADGAPNGEEARHGGNKPGKNASTNQVPAIGSLAFQWDNESEDSGESEVAEAMAYLKAVRQERQSIPLVLTAPGLRNDEDIYEEGDSRGFFEDDCYIARPVMRPQPPLKATVSPREAYTNSLSHRFRKLRAQLRKPPEPSSMTDSSTLLNPQHGDEAYACCVHAVRETAPSLSQLIAMSDESVFAMLELIDNHCLGQRKHISRNTGTWLMVLFARLDDVGTMDGDQVSQLRELGKKAVIVQMSFVNAAAAAQLEEVAAKERYAGAVEGQREVMDGEDAKADTTIVDEDAAGVSAEPSASDAEDTEHTLATLDMILTVVGEFFGQRDLLEFRRSWEPEA